MPLTDTALRNARPDGSIRRLYDSEGLYVEIAPSGGKWFRLKYRFNGKEKRISLGVYPEVTLKAARDRRDFARRLVASGIDPSQDRKQQKALQASQEANTFETVTREWFEKNSSPWVRAHADRKIRLFERDIFPALGKRPIAQIEPPDLLEVLQTIEARGAKDTAKRALIACAQVFRYAVATRRIKSDPSRDLRGALKPIQNQHFAATTDLKKLAGILRALDDYEGTTVVRCALRLAPLVFVRPGELRTARWADIDLDAAEWRYMVTKTGTPHIVPLSRQAVAILREVLPITERGQFVFPSARSNKRPMSDNAILSAMRRMDISRDEMTGHGWRAVARTLLDEELHVRPDLIEHQLAHAVRDPNGRAYNRTSFLVERRQMMQQWADHLDTLKADAAGFALA
jgi:integrase